ncbi:unnamed protein product [Ranitomeya imitator]|uniref:G-protein coupled receptors family 3 profile domain-containing protein n=1 Tax=Ranitomeya imitator TaxID=111125 RepID=A0ABN9LQ27_9NEOB|nr:unnamed protein product [Ranitomeya imitator]
MPRARSPVGDRGSCAQALQHIPLVLLADAVECFKCPWDKRPNLQRTKCVPKTEDYLSYEEPLGTTLAITNVASSLVPYIILRILALHKASALVKASNYSISCLLLVSLSFCFLCSLFFIGYPKPVKCLLRQAAFGMVFVLCVSCILAKTILVLLAFMAIKPRSNKKKWTNTRVSYVIISAGSIFQALLCIIWLSLRPPFMQYDFHVNPEVIIVECNEGSLIAFWIMLGYLFLLAAISFLVAFLVRRLPDSFNEAQFITFSMLTFLCVWVSFIPASLSAQGKYTVAMEIFAIMASSWAILLCMFVPKCFIIVFQPNRNSKDYVMNRHRNPVIKDSRMGNLEPSPLRSPILLLPQWSLLSRGVGPSVMLSLTLREGLLLSFQLLPLWPVLVSSEQTSLGLSPTFPLLSMPRVSSLIGDQASHAQVLQQILLVLQEGPEGVQGLWQSLIGPSRKVMYLLQL